MSHITLRCNACGASHVADMETLACRECAFPLDVEYLDVGWRGKGVRPRGRGAPRAPLPLHDPDSGVALVAGGTPCVELPAAAALLGLRRLFGKLEFLNPTGSFKDRGTAVMMAVATENDVKELVEDSTGNAGASVSAYAARAGIKAHIFAPASAAPAKLRQIRAYGAEVHAIDGSRDATAAAAVAYHTQRRLVYTSHALSPYFLEGTKTFAYEVARRFSKGLPAHIVFPVGNGGLLLGAWKGFVELRDAEHIAGVPRLHAVQSRAFMPLVAAHRGEEWTADLGRGTVAGGIAVEAPARQEQLLDVLRAAHGEAVAVDDEDVLRWHGLLATEEGIYAEPTSAAAFAGLEQLVRLGVVEAADTVLVPITGSGLKDAPPE